MPPRCLKRHRPFSGYGLVLVRFGHVRGTVPETWPFWTGSGASGCCSASVRKVDRSAEGDKARLLDRLAERRVRGHAVRDSLHGGLRVERDGAGLDQVGHVRPDHDEAEQLAVAALVDGLHPADGLVLHHRAGVGDPREHADLDVVAVLLARLGLGEPDARNLRVGVDRTRHGAVVDDGLVAHRVLGRDLALAEGGVGELPVAGAVADGVDVLLGRAAVLVGGDALALVELDADLLKAEVLDGRAAPGRNEHQVALGGLASVVATSAAAGFSTLSQVVSRWSVIPRLPNCFASSLAASASSWGIRPGSISMIVTSEPKRRKIDANSQPMIPPPSTTRRLGTSVCASRPVESTQRGESSPSMGGRSANEPVAITACLKVTSSAPSTWIVFASVKRPVPLTHSTPAALKRLATPEVICLTTPSFHWFAVGKSRVGAPTWTPSLPNVSSASLIANAVCTHALVGTQPTRRQVPPSSGSFSMQIVLAPSCAARIAAV